MSNAKRRHRRRYRKAQWHVHGQRCLLAMIRHFLPPGSHWDEFEQALKTPGVALQLEIIDELENGL